MNEFASLSEDDGSFNEHSPEKPSSPMLQIGDLVSLTIVDVFETDNQGKLLSYCPTFDNRAVQKTNQAAETVRKTSNKFFSMIGRAQKDIAKSEANRKATAQLSKFGIMQQAKNVAENMKHKVDEAVQNYSSPNRRAGHQTNVTDLEQFEQAMTAAEAAATGTTTSLNNHAEDNPADAAEHKSDGDLGDEGDICAGDVGKTAEI